MAIGFSTDKAAMDNRAASIAKSVRDSLVDASRMKAWLDTQTEAELVARGWTAAEVAVIKSAFTDLDNLHKVTTGQATQATANDFLFWASKLLGAQ